MLEFTTPSAASEGNYSSTDNLEANFSSNPENQTEQAELEEFEVFARADLEALTKSRHSPLLRITQTLVSIAQEAPIYETDNPIYGRFELCSYAESAFDNRLTFRLVRQALDFLEADYLACEQSDLDFWRLQVDKIDAMRNGSPLEETTTIVGS